MSSPKWCNLCNRNIIPKKDFSWVGFVFGAGFLYMAYYLFLKKRRCPICSGDSFGPPKASEMGK